MEISLVHEYVAWDDPNSEDHMEVEPNYSKILGRAHAI